MSRERLNRETAIEVELLAFAIENVGEKPAKHRSVMVIEVMPLTNVGKIYRPKLRRLAAAKHWYSSTTIFDLNLRPESPGLIKSVN